MSIATLLLLIALILFVLAAFGVGGRIGLLPLGLACMAAAALVGKHIIG